MDTQHTYIKRCLQLAANALGNVAPNPMVGAVIVHCGKIIGEGWHQKYGEAHAEVNAINSVLQNHKNAEQLLKESTLYVNLEPCAHQGKTPPCAELIVRHKIPKVVIGMVDPFEKVAGKGIKILEDSGIEVTSGVLEEDSKELNRRFITFQTQRRPYIILKWAQTQNGFFAPKDGTQHWITSPLSKKLVHKWRSEEQAILVGYQTALTDNPQLNVREWAGKNPVRIVIDKDLKLPGSLNLFDKSVKTVVFNAHKTDVEGNLHFMEVENWAYLPQLLLYQLYLMDIQSVIIEGGLKTLQQFIHAGLCDEARILTGNNEIVKGLAAPLISGKLIEKMSIGDDELRIYRNV